MKIQGDLRHIVFIRQLSFAWQAENPTRPVCLSSSSFSSFRHCRLRHLLPPPPLPSLDPMRQ